MQSVKRTRREIGRLVLTIAMACMMAVLLASCTTHEHPTPPEQETEHEHHQAVTQEDVENTVKEVVGPVIEVLVRETSEAINENSRGIEQNRREKYPKEPPSINHPGNAYIEGGPMPFYAPALREPVLLVEKPGWSSDIEGIGQGYDLKVTNITTDKYLVDLEVHEMLPPETKFKYISHSINGVFPDRVPPAPLPKRGLGRGLHGQTAIFSWNVFGPGDSSTITIVGNVPQTALDLDERRSGVSDTGEIISIYTLDEPFYTAVDYMLAGRQKLEDERREGVSLGIRGDFHDMVDPVVLRGRPFEKVRFLAVLRNQSPIDVDVRRPAFKPMAEIVAGDSSQPSRYTPSSEGPRVSGPSEGCNIMAALENISNSTQDLSEMRSKRIREFNDRFDAARPLLEDVINLRSGQCVEMLYTAIVDREEVPFRQTRGGHPTITLLSTFEAMVTNRFGNATVRDAESTTLIDDRRRNP